MNSSDEEQRKHDVVQGGEEPPVTVPLTSVPEDQPENLDFAFDDPRLDAWTEREIERSRETLDRKVEALHGHLNGALKIVSQIKALFREDPA